MSKKLDKDLNPIDIVVPWVDGSDPDWLSLKKQYTPSSMCDTDESRYRASDTFKYWFRAIEKNAPWVHKVHFLTFRHVPEWLNIDHPKLQIVQHQDFIPQKYLPTFSSHVIEMNLHQIPGLASQFIYFNDDVFLIKESRREDFFRNDLPMDAAILGMIKNNHVENFMPYIMLNMMAIINMNFNKNYVIKNHLGKWFSFKYRKLLLNNLYLMPFSSFTGFRNFHTATPFLKETIQEVWSTIPEIMQKVCKNKFRSKEDINQYIFRYWQLAKGQFIPHKINSAYITMGKFNRKQLTQILNNKHYLTVCINDDPGDFNFDSDNKMIEQELNQILPDKSSFER